jgi:uncharacterized protein (TIGR02246 family)
MTARCGRWSTGRCGPLMVSTARRAPNLHRSSPAGPSAGGKGDTRPHVVVGHPPSGDCWESPLGAWRTDDSEPATHATGPSPRTGSLTPTPGADTDADDEARIRTLIERWAQAVHAGDLDGVLADHATDIVMFDVPPPNGGVRGIDAYRATWPPFFDWQRQGAVFEIVDLDVTAGDDVAFAHALLRCGTPTDLEKDPGNRLRLSIGLRKESGRWIVTHEHHSFPSP